MVVRVRNTVDFLFLFFVFFQNSFRYKNTRLDSNAILSCSRAMYGNPLSRKPIRASTKSPTWTWRVQRLWCPTSVTAGKLPVSLVPQCKTMSDGPSRGTRDRRPILPQIVFVRDIEIEEEEWKRAEFRHCSLVKSAGRTLRFRDSGITTVCFPSFLQRSSIGSLTPYLLRASRL